MFVSTKHTVSLVVVVCQACCPSIIADCPQPGLAIEGKLLFFPPWDPVETRILALFDKWVGAVFQCVEYSNFKI